ncbi:PIG-P [Schizophyllum amplum]|uniref:PIG-P n=1 Tax=Schizophyllum amplum TaxID=97359 RepID=A0A550CBV1_9AGAR|nr:PIG-P [Auriculariopsis ampla]
MGRVRSTSSSAPLASYPAHEHSRAPEFYGFVAWTSTYLLFGLYLLWALLPDALIIRLGIDWYPSREWSLLLPAYSIILVLLTYFTYFALALYNQPAMSSASTITDSYSRYPSYERLHSTGPMTAELLDAPIDFVNKALYS